MDSSLAVVAVVAVVQAVAEPEGEVVVVEEGFREEELVAELLQVVEKQMELFVLVVLLQELQLTREMLDQAQHLVQEDVAQEIQVGDAFPVHIMEAAVAAVEDMALQEETEMEALVVLFFHPVVHGEMEVRQGLHLEGILRAALSQI